MRKGFTLVELLAVIVILAIILAITIPGISNVINNSTKASFESNIKLIIKAIEYKKMENENFDVTQINEKTLNSNLNIANENYQLIKTNMSNGDIKVGVIGSGKWQGLVAYGTYKNLTISDISTNLVGYWKLDNDVTDYTSNEYDGTIVGTPTVDNGLFGQCYKFDGYPDYINLPYGLGLNTSQSYSFSMWVKASSTGGCPLFFAVNNGAPQRLYIGILFGKWDIGIQSNAWDTNQSKTTATTNWTNITLTLNGSTAKLYINGVFSMNKDYTPYNLASNFTIGNHGGGMQDSSYQFFGLIDDVRIYNVALSENEINNLYNLGLQ